MEDIQESNFYNKPVTTLQQNFMPHQNKCPFIIKHWNTGIKKEIINKEKNKKTVLKLLVFIDNIDSVSNSPAPKKLLGFKNNSYMGGKNPPEL